LEELKLFYRKTLLVLAITAVCFQIGCTSSDSNDEDIVDGDICGGAENVQCPVGQYCRFPDFTCGFGGVEGQCLDIPSACEASLASICACDGVTYRNTCLAAAEGLSIFAYQACSNLVQGQGEVCGGPSGISCGGGLFCNYPDGSCGAGDTFGLCTQIVFECPLDPVPVCGCDGQTYQNACLAAAAGVSGAYLGVCR
jgi:hypothetical protein